MLDRTRRLWEKQHHSVGDRRGLYAAVAERTAVRDVLYPGSYVDLAPSTVWPSVTYVDVDRRARRFFEDEDGVQELVRELSGVAQSRSIRFIAADYADDLPLAEGSFDLLISLYAGFVSEHCTRYLRPGGLLLVNSSHGDAAMASIDPRYRLSFVVQGHAGRFSLRSDDLDTYLVPKRDTDITVDLLQETGRGIAYTRSTFAYLFQRVG